MANSPTVLVTGSSISPDLLRPLTDAGFNVRFPRHTLTESELIGELAQADVYLYGGDEEATASAIKSTDALRLIAFYGVGYESFIPVEAVKDRGVRVTNTPGTLSNSVAEFTIGQLLNCRRKIASYAFTYAQGKSGDEVMQRDIAGHRVGIVGMGGIGTRIAEILRNGFRADVSYFSRTRKPDLERTLDIRFLDLDNLFSASESIIVMVPGNAQTNGLIGDNLLGRLEDGAVIVNTARPEVVDPVSLLSHLRSGRLAGAAVDGFYSDELAVTAELKRLQPDPLLITGHIGSLTHDARDAMTRRCVQSIINFIATGTDECLVM